MKVRNIEVNRKNFTTQYGYCGDCMDFEWNTPNKSCNKHNDEKLKRCLLLDAKPCNEMREGYHG